MTFLRILPSGSQSFQFFEENSPQFFTKKTLTESQHLKCTAGRKKRSLTDFDGGGYGVLCFV